VIDGLILFFSLLSVIAMVGAIGVGFVLIAGRGAGRLAAARTMLVREMGDLAVAVAATVATTATLGSLFMSEVADYVPCRLCWVQRVFMYPLAVFLIVAAVRRVKGAWKVAIPWSAIGGLVSIYHYAEQRMWIGGSEGFCDASVPCTFTWVWRFGFISIPFMALTGFAFVVVLMALHRARSAKLEPSRENR